MYKKNDDVDVYQIRTYRWPLQAAGADVAAEVEVIQHRLGIVRPEAHYDPLGGYRGLEWTFEDAKGEPYMFYQHYGVWYVSNRSGGIELTQFRDWIVQRLTNGPEVPAPAVTVKAPTPSTSALVEALPLRNEDHDEYQDYAEEYIRSLY